jgi:FkbM family methyltransferase
MRLMKFIFLRHLLPKSVRRAMRDRWKELLIREYQREERRLYRQFVAPGDLVFDVGANVGLKTETFLALGARVIAVEPNPDCADVINRRCRRAVDEDLLHIVSSAVGARPGQLTLRLYRSESSMTSGSVAFAETLAAWGTVATGKIEVGMVTLDDLIRRFGTPTFIKVDVEGMDAEVLQGLRQRPKFLSFEYNLNPSLWPNTKRCVGEAIRLGFTEANFTELTSPRLLLNAWVPLGTVEAAIAGHCTGYEWGDVLVR